MSWLQADADVAQLQQKFVHHLTVHRRSPKQMWTVIKYCIIYTVFTSLFLMDN